MKSPAFQFYPGDWLSNANIQLLTLEEEGAYIRLLGYCWIEGNIPNDPESCARLIGKGASTTLVTKLLPRFEQDPNHPTRLINSRLEKEREKQRQWQEKSKFGGIKSGESRKRASETKGGSNLVGRLVQPNGNIPSPSPSPSSNKEQSARDIEEIYAAYPRKVSRKDALIAISKALKKLSKDVLLRKTIEFAESVKGEEPKYIPHPATWFNKERFNDEMELFKPKSDLAIRYANHPCNKDSKNFTYDYTPEQAEEFRKLKAEYERQITS